MLLLNSFFIVNCSDSTSNDDGSLEGIWLLTKVTYTVPIYGSIVEYPEEEGYSVHLTIRDDHTYTTIESSGDYSDTTNGTWSTSGNNLTIYEEGEDPMETEYSVKGDKLKIVMDVDFGDVIVPSTNEFTRQ
ncbi:MAG: lipocalin family protein [Calditrichaceae bacterium]